MWLYDGQTQSIGRVLSTIHLLDKTRKIGKLLHNNNDSKLVFDDICQVLSDVMNSNVLVVSKKGKILGMAEAHGLRHLLEFSEACRGSFLDEALNERLLSILSTKENVKPKTIGLRDPLASIWLLITPIVISGERLGTLVMYKDQREYEIDDLILCEYATSVVGLELLRSQTEEAKEEKRKRDVVLGALSTLSLSETQAILCVFDELNGMEGMLVASRIAEEVGITRSVIVNAIRKFESAGLIASKSSGMKGTYIKVLNDGIYEELDFLRKNRIRML